LKGEIILFISDFNFFLNYGQKICVKYESFSLVDSFPFKLAVSWTHYRVSDTFHLHLCEH
jgi:hypothetical protein